jgi:RHS repeat-associated protein
MKPNESWIPTAYSTQTPQSNVFSKNRWGIAGVSYDLAGNQTSLQVATGSTRMFTYDAENRVVSANIPNIGAVTYAYDGDGRRVSKTVAGLPGSTFVYGATGNLVAEYGGASGYGQTAYVTADHLGSTRMAMSGTNPATVLARYDYAPFGEELTSGLDGRNSPYQGNQYPMSTPDGMPNKYTSKERDAETGLDFFGTRYMSSAQGRWTSPDSINLTNERALLPSNTLNKYIYGGNNPLKYTDPDGRDITIFYEDGWPTGHVMMAAFNQQTNDFAFLSVGPQTHFDPAIMNPVNLFSGVPGASEFQLPQTADDLRKNFSALTIQTSPEVA